MSNIFSHIKFLLLCLLFISHIHAVEPQQKQLLSPNETLVLLEKIKPYAIVFGEGDREVHTFIDPYCPVSQRHLTFIFEDRERTFKRNTYYFYLYEIKRRNSKEMIQTILSAESRKQTLKAVMVDDDIVFLEENSDVDDEIRKIENAAQQIGVYKRPYIIIDGKVQ